MRATLCIVYISLHCLMQAGCSTVPAPATAPTAAPAIKSSDYVATREEAFAAWQKRERQNTNPGGVIWDCALCPRLVVHRSGKIWFGSDESEAHRGPDESPLTEVAIPAWFAIGQYEVTRGEFNAFLAATGRRPRSGCHTDRESPGTWRADSRASFADPGFAQDDDHPAVCVSWQDANDYVAWLNSLTTGGYRLPSEAEWQFGGFGGGYETYIWGELPDPACTYANVLDATGASAHPRTGSLRCNDGAVATAAVGGYLRNATRMHDMIGNAAEWTSTCDDGRAAGGSACARAVVKGGSWKSTGPELRLAARNLFPVAHRDNSIGFRVVRAVQSPDAPLPDARAYLDRGRLMLSVLENQRALADLEEAVRLKPDDPDAIASRGWAYFRSADHAKAEADFTAALAADPENVEAIAGLGTLALSRGVTSEAIRQLDRAIVLAPDYIMALSIRAYAHVNGGELERALADSARVLEMEPTDIELPQLRIRVRGMRREWPLAIEEIHRFTRVFPTLDEVQRFAAQRYSDLLQDDDALIAANRAVRIWPKAENYLVRAEVRPWQDIEGRRADVEAALESEPDSSPANKALGDLEFRLGNYEAALKAYTRASRQDVQESHRVDALIGRGIVYSRLGDSASASRDFEAALGPKPNAAAFNKLCWRLTLSDTALERAMEYCNRALALAPGRSSLVDSKALLLLRLGRWQEAIEAYDKALEKNPNLGTSLYGRGIASQMRCKCDTGIDDLRKALQQFPGTERTFERVGFVAPFPAR